MKKNILIIIPAILMGISTLSGCHKESQHKDETPQLVPYKSDSRFVASSFVPGGYINLPTYHYSPCGDVPYIKLNDFAVLANNFGSLMMVQKLGVGLYGLYNRGQTCVRFDTDLDNIFVIDMDILMADFIPMNNNVGSDLASPNDSDVSAVHTSLLTNCKDGIQEEVYRLKDYNFDIVEYKDHCYLPVQLISSLIFRSFGFDLAYNGIDYYLSTAINDPTQLGPYCSFRSSDHSFYMDGKIFKKGQPIKGEKYRYIYDNVSATDSSERYHFFSFKEGGTGEYLIGNNPNSTGQPVSMNSTMRIKWSEDRNGLYTNVYLFPIDVDENKQDMGTFKIAYDKGYFATGKRSRDIIEFNYNLLRLQFDRFYGLKEILEEKYGYQDFDSFVEQENLKEGLLSENSTEYDAALAKFTMGYLDDGHTNYLGTSVNSIGVGKDHIELTNEYVGPRRQSLANYQKTYLKLRTDVLSENDESYKDTAKQQDLFIYDKTAAIRFDMFTEPNDFILNEMTEETDISATITKSVAAGFDLAFEQIKANDDIENIVIDLTCNGGGMVSDIPYLSAFFTSDPSIQCMDTAKNIRKDLHYEVDLNHDGIYAGEEDTYEGKYNFYILTSEFSFSCANALPTYAKYHGIPIIGKKSGGGSCTIVGFCDTCGSVYTTSSINKFCFADDDDNFVTNDGGVPVDYNLDSDSWYDMEKLNAFVTSLNN